MISTCRLQYVQCAASQHDTAESLVKFNPIIQDTSVNGTTLTITRNDEDEGWDWTFKLRAYNPSEEVIPDSTSTLYTYYGLNGKLASSPLKIPQESLFVRLLLPSRSVLSVNVNISGAGYNG